MQNQRTQITDAERGLMTTTSGTAPSREHLSGSRGTDDRGILPQETVDELQQQALGPPPGAEARTKRPVNVWANGPDTPTLVCADARLEGRESPVQYPHGTISGQAGWDMGINFTNLDDLANRLTLNPLATPEHVSGKPITKGQIGRLAINVHGTIGGQLLINGKNRPPLTARNIEEWRRQLEDIGLATTEHAMILFMGCNAGLGKDGTELLKALSTIWRDRQVVAFFTIGFAMGGEMKRRGQACTEPGMRVTDYVYASRDPRLEEETKKKWKNLQELPWAWEESKSAKVALNGEILRGVGF